MFFGPQDFTKTPNDTFEVSRDGTKSTISYIDYVREAYRGSDVVAGDIDPRRPGPLSSPPVPDSILNSAALQNFLLLIGIATTEECALGYIASQTVRPHKAGLTRGDLVAASRRGADGTLGASVGARSNVSINRHGSVDVRPQASRPAWESSRVGTATSFSPSRGTARGSDAQSRTVSPSRKAQVKAHANRHGSVDIRVV